METSGQDEAYTDPEQFVADVQALFRQDGGMTVEQLATRTFTYQDRVRRILRSEQPHDDHLGLVDIFSACSEVRTSFPRHVPEAENTDLDDKYLFHLSTANRRKLGDPCFVQTLDEFERNWSLISEGAFAYVRREDWRHLVVGGGAALISGTPLSEEVRATETATREFYHKVAYPSSDIDVFIHGLNAQEAIEMIKSLYEAISKAIDFPVLCHVSPYSFTMQSNYPYRRIQIVLRLFQSPSDILHSFDLGPAACLYDGRRVFMTCGAVLACITQSIELDLSRRAPSYEYRVVKYTCRPGFYEFHAENLDKTRIDPKVFHQSVFEAKGLARLLGLDNAHKKGFKRQSIENANHTPPGPLQDALHHIRFWRGNEEREKSPSRRLSPEEFESWSRSAYGSDVQIFFSSISLHYPLRVRRIITLPEFNLNQRDGRGMSGLHLAIVSKAEDIAIELIDCGIDPTACLPDGRNAFHLAAQVNMPSVITRLIARLAELRGAADDASADDASISTRQSTPSLVEAEHEFATDEPLTHIDRLDDAGISPLCCALMSGSKECASLLLKARADSRAVNCVASGLRRLDVHHLVEGGSPAEFHNWTFFLDTRRECGYYLPPVDHHETPSLADLD